MFPYEGKSKFLSSADPAVQELQQAVLRVQDMLLAACRVDPDVKLIARFDGNLLGHLGQQGTGTVPIRYWKGKFDASTGLLVEEGGSNLLPNPSAEVDTSSWSANDKALNLSRSTTVSYKENGTVSVASFMLAGSSKAGPGYIKSTVAVSTNTSYSASAYVYSGQAVKAKLEAAFTGGTPVSYDTGEVTLTAGGWTRLELADKDSTNNTSCEVRLYLVQLAPEFATGSRFSKLTPTGTALVTDNALVLTAGDVVMIAASANPSNAEKYSLHMVTTGATGVSSSALRLDGAGAAPTFVPGSRLSQWTPNATVLETDNTTTLNVGDWIFCKLDDDVGAYGWHVVTTAGTAASAALRLDDGPAQPNFAPGSRISRFVPTASAAVTDGAMTITAGDVAMAHTLAFPGSDGYQFHMVTTGATGVSSSALRLNGATSAPTFAAGSLFSKLTPTATALVTDGAMTITAGDFAFCIPTRNPAETGYGWHVATTGATGVSSSALRLDQCSSDTIHADALQFEAGDVVSSYIDSFQGPGFSGGLGGATMRAESGVSFDPDGVLAASAGTVAFWMYPFWAGNDGTEHVLFDVAVDPTRDRLRLSKSRGDQWVLSVYDTNGQLKQIVSSGTLSFSARTWQHVAFTWSGGTLKLYHNGALLSVSTVGSGTGQVTNFGDAARLGSDFDGVVTGGAVYDDLVTKKTAATANEIAAMAVGNSSYQGLAAAWSGFAMATGSATTDASAGTQTAVAHGLGATPGFVVLTPKGNGAVYLSAASDATNFYVKGSAASLDFNWRALA